MPEMKVGDPPATLTAVERTKGVPTPIKGTLAWSVTPGNGSLAELAPGDSPDAVKLVAKSEGAVQVTVADPEFGLSAALDVTILPAPPPAPDSIEIEFTPGTAS